MAAESADEVGVTPGQLIAPPDIQLPNVPLLAIIQYMDDATLSAFAHAIMSGDHNTPTLQLAKTERTRRVARLFDAVIQSPNDHSVDAITRRMRSLGVVGRRLAAGALDYTHWRVGGHSLAVNEPPGGRIRKITRMSPNECIQVEMYANGNTNSICYSTAEYGSHRSGGLPATVVWHDNGVMSRREYVVADQYHREGGVPAVQVWDRHGTLMRELYYEADKLHRAGGEPATRTWDMHGNLLTEEYRERDELHRIGGLPALQHWDAQGRLLRVEYYEHDKLHRADNLPARIVFEPPSVAQVVEEYWVNGQLHRDDLPNGTPQPAVILRAPSGRVRQQQFWKDGWTRSH
jgi:hypothetical protein